jgi:diguanylate cyclase (GGDEF)-like protein
MLEDHKLDGYVTVDSFVNPGRAVPMYQVGSSDFYFAVNKDRPDLLKDLNEAMTGIHNENRYFNQQMFDQYITTTGANAFLSSSELGWLSEHGTIRVGYQDDYLAFCATDKTTGKLTGALKDYLAYASDCMENGHLDFEPKAFPTAADALEALKRGEVDCVFPASLGGYDSEKRGIVKTPPLMSTDVYAVVRQADMRNFTNREHVVVAVNQGNPNYDAFLVDNFPTWQTVYFASTADCLKAVADNMADCVLISSYRYNNISRLCERYHLTTFPTAVSLDSSFAVAKGNTDLYSVLAKVVSQVPASTVNSSLSFYITEDAKRTLGDFLADHMVVVLAGIGIVTLVVTLLLMRSLRAEKIAKNLIAATEIDVLTGIYNRDYFFQYANRMRREQPDEPMDAIVLNIERFHSINALNGRDFGDQVLRVLGNDIRILAEEAGGIAGRFGADRFDVFCPHQGDYSGIYDRLQGKLEALAPSASIRLRMGVLPAQTQIEPVQMFDMARTACSMARGHFKEHVIIFDEQVRKRELFEQRLLNDLRRALDNYEFEVHYQPIYCLADGRFHSAEALVRLNDPTYGWVPPALFIPEAEQNGTIVGIGDILIEKICAFLGELEYERTQLHYVEVNLSTDQFIRPGMVPKLLDALERHGVAPKRVNIEITETSSSFSQRVVEGHVRQLAEAGLTLSLDDYGTGYSSLARTLSLPFTLVKLDKSLVDGLADPAVREVLSHTVAMMKAIGKDVLAEGVETREQVEQLGEMGVDYIQGYYFSKPLPEADFVRFLESQ